MVKDKRFRILAFLVVGLAAVLLWTRGGPTASPPVPAARPADPAAGADGDLPRIDLSRLQAAAEVASAGKRDIFNFGPERPREDALASLPPALPPTPVSFVTTNAPPPPTVAPLSVKYIGSLENKRGLRVAILLTDRKEILTGQAGQLVANRFRIVKIGYESVDIQDVGSERVRRIPYKGN